MILQTIKDTFSSLLTDVGVVGWLVIGLYVVLFSMRVFLKVISIKRARINRVMHTTQDVIITMAAVMVWV